MKPIKTIDLDVSAAHKLGKAFVSFVVEVYPDESFDISEVEHPDDVDAFERGDMESYVVMVRARINPMPWSGSDVLGGVWAKSDKDILDAVFEHGMKENALSDLNKVMTRDIRLMKGFDLL